MKRPKFFEDLDRSLQGEDVFDEAPTESAQPEPIVILRLNSPVAMATSLVAPVPWVIPGEYMPDE